MRELTDHCGVPPFADLDCRVSFSWPVSYRPSCCNCCAGHRKKVYASINRPHDEMCLWFFPEGASPTVIAVFSKSIGQIYTDRFATNPAIDMDSM